MLQMYGADELYLKVRGNPKYLFALMDDQTRFRIAQQVADTKYTNMGQFCLYCTKSILESHYPDQE
jgi:hypothetical protein